MTGMKDPVCHIQTSGENKVMEIGLLTNSQRLLYTHLLLKPQ